MWTLHKFTFFQLEADGKRTEIFHVVNAIIVTKRLIMDGILIHFIVKFYNKRYYYSLMFTI